MVQPGSPAASMPPDESHIMRRLADLEGQIRELRAADILRTAGMSASPGLVASTDYNGASDASLGSQGWMLGTHDGGPSLLALNGVNVYADLAAKTAQLQAQANYQASLISRDALAAGFNTGTLINDSAFHLVGGQAVISNMPVPTGKVRIMIGNSEVSINSAGNSVIGAITYGIDGVQALDPNDKFARLYAPAQLIGVSLTRIGTVTMPPGTYTFRAQAAYWSAGAGAASVNFSGTRLLVEVIGND